MLDEDFKLHLIECNTNPCLDTCCPLLSRIIPEVIDNAFRIVLDPLFPSPDLSQHRKFQLNELPQEVKFTLIFDEDFEGAALRGLAEKCRTLQTVKEEHIESDVEEELLEGAVDSDEY